MWTELVEMVEKRCRDGDCQRRDQARASVLLYGSLVNCHEAFKRCKANQSDVDLANASFAMDALISALQNLDGVLSLFDPDVGEKLKRYALEEGRTAYMANPKERLRNQVELLRTTLNAETEAMYVPIDDLNAFSGSKAMLGAFIHGRFSLDELFKEHLV